MHTMPVVFMLQPPTVKGRFAVHPHTGILAPLTAVTVEVVYLVSAAPEGPSGSRTAMRARSCCRAWMRGGARRCGERARHGAGFDQLAVLVCEEEVGVCGRHP